MMVYHLVMGFISTWFIIVLNSSALSTLQYLTPLPLVLLISSTRRTFRSCLQNSQ